MGELWKIYPFRVTCQYCPCPTVHVKLRSTHSTFNLAWRNKQFRYDILRHSVCLIKIFNHSVRPIALHKLGLMVNSFLCIRWRLQHSLSSSHHGSEAALVSGTTSPQPTTNNDSSGRADDSHDVIRDEMTSLRTTHVEHMQRIVEWYDRWNEAVRLLDTFAGVYYRLHSSVLDHFGP